jgi:DNA-binding response OmpR family regulator
MITQSSGGALACPPDGDGQPRILVIDDEHRIGEYISRTLSLAGCAIDFTQSGWAGLRQAVRDAYDLVILDLVMPDMDGRAVLAGIMQHRPGQAVLVLSCLGEVTSKVECLDLGAQDYLTKPFSLDELLARVRARLRAGGRTIPDWPLTGDPNGAEDNGSAGDGPGAPRDAASGPALDAAPGAGPAGGLGAAHGGVLRVGGLAVDVGHLRADFGHGPVALTRLEFLLLRALMEDPGHSVPKGQLLASVWGYEFDPGSNVVDVCVRRLRRKLGFGLIKTVRGQGYQLEAG